LLCDTSFIDLLPVRTAPCETVEHVVALALKSSEQEQVAVTRRIRRADLACTGARGAVSLSAWPAHKILSFILIDSPLILELLVCLSTSLLITSVPLIHDV
jgi:hypothetical protein